MNELKPVIKDPICGMIVNEATAIKTERDGKQFYFCSNACLQKFLSTSDSKPAKNTGDCCS